MFIALVLAALSAPSADLTDDAKKQLKDVQGDWTLVSWVIGGEERVFPAEEQVPVTITGTKFTFGKYGDGEFTALDPAADPKTLDFKMLRKPESGVTNEAVFKVDKDTLTVVVYLGEGSKRPAGFDAACEKGSNVGKFVLQRTKK